MAQTLKDEVRDRIQAAAERTFARSGYGSATMAGIAKEAGISTGNVYRYYENKDALFYAVVSDEFVQRFMRLLKRRVAALVEADDLEVLNEDAKQRADALLQFWIEHRLKVVIVFERAQGSRHEAFTDRFVKELCRLSIAKMKRETPTLEVSAVLRHTLNNIFRNTVRAIVSVLETYTREAQIREAFAAFWSFQLAGLAGISRWANDQ